MEKKIVYISSPYRPVGDDPQKEIKENLALARRACRYALDTGCVPYAPHLLFPQFISEGKERRLGMEAGLVMLELADELWVIGNRISEGMTQEISLAVSKGIPVITVIDPMVAEEHLLDAVFGGEEIMTNEQN